jgi:hypothetical protein
VRSSPFPRRLVVCNSAQTGIDHLFMATRTIITDGEIGLRTRSDSNAGPYPRLHFVID